MKFFVFLAAFSALNYVFAGDAEYNIKEPYKSRGLTSVNMSLKKDLPPLIIAKDGKALVPIVCSKTGYYQQVAQLLKKYLDKATGADFSISHEAPAKGKAIFIGDFNKTLFAKAQKMPDESFLIESIPQGIVLAGKDAFAKNRLKKKSVLNMFDRNQSRGTFFAMADFLERLIGMRFYFPGIGMHIPNLTKGEVSIAPVSYSDTPVFDFRALGYGGGKDLKLIKVADFRKEISEWQALLKLADIKSKKSYHTDKDWHKVFGKTHPEYFALRKDGSRAIGDRGRYSAYRCYSSEAGFKAHIQAIEDVYKGKGNPTLFNSYKFTPNKRYIHWGMADAFRGCNCEGCLKLTDADAGDSAHSRLIANYILKLAKECKKRWPDKVLKFHVYGPIHNLLPIIEKDNPGNLLICPVRIGPKASSAAYLKEKIMWDKTQDYLNKLRTLSAEKPYIWLHYPHRPATGTPCIALHYYRDFIARNKNIVSGMLFNGHRSYSYAFSSFIVYVIKKISWNPEINIDACLEEYCTTLFGPAAPIMKDYYKTLMDRWENVKWKNVPDVDRRFDDIIEKSAYFKETYPENIRNKLEKMLLEARALTQKGTIYYDRMDWMVKGSAPFFNNGRYFDSGKRYSFTCFNWTPAEIDGLLKENWSAQGVPGLRLRSNETGKFDKKTLFGLIRISHDDKNLYIGGKIESKDAFITKGKGKKSPRDSDIWAYDSLEIFLSTEQPGMKESGLLQQSQYHQIIIDPDGSIFDAYENNNGVNLKIDYKVYTPFKDAKNDKYINNKMYFEMAIPFSELKCIPPHEGSKWYINFYWNRKRNGKHTSYTWSGIGRHHDTGRFGELIFTDKKPVKKKITETRSKKK
jgi:hypothetical protein